MNLSCWNCGEKFDGGGGNGKCRAARVRLHDGLCVTPIQGCAHDTDQAAPVFMRTAVVRGRAEGFKHRASAGEESVVPQKAARIGEAGVGFGCDVGDEWRIHLSLKSRRVILSTAKDLVHIARSLATLRMTVNWVRADVRLVVTLFDKT